MHNILPVCLPSAVDCSLILLQVNQGYRELCKVRNIVVQQLSGLVHTRVEASISDFPNIRVIRTRDELLEVREPWGLGVREYEFAFDICVSGLLPRHLEVTDKVLPRLCFGGRGDHVKIGTWVIGLKKNWKTFNVFFKSKTFLFGPNVII